MAGSLVARFSKKGDLVYDPFSGCGTFAFEAWAAGREVIANDLSPYANVLTRAKLFPYHCLQDGLLDIDHMATLAAENLDNVDLRKVPLWVREFFIPKRLGKLLLGTPH